MSTGRTEGNGHGVRLGALVAGVTCAAWAALLAQDQALRVVLKSEIVEVASEGTQAPAQPGMPGAMGSVMKQMLMPEGVLEVVTLTRGEAMRMEYRNAMAQFARGSVVLRPAGSADTFVLNPAEKTYFKTPMDTTGRMGPSSEAGAEPTVTFTPTGRTEEIAGHRAEHATVEVSYPAPAGAGGVPGVPGQMTVSGELWYAEGLLTEAEARTAQQMMQAIPMIGGAGANSIAKPGRVVLRSRARMSMLPGYEFRTEVVSVGRVSADAHLFVLPPDYREVPMPMPRMPAP